MRFVRRAVFLGLSALLLALLVPLQALAAGAVTATFTKSSDWGSGYEGKYTITNGTSAAISSWKVDADVPAGTSVGTYWDSLLTSSGQHVTFKNREYNGTVAAGASVSFGFVASGSGAPQNCTINGAACTGDSGPGTPGAPGTPGPPSVSGRSDSSLTLTWTASSGTVTGYRVYEGTTVRATTTSTSATLSGLAACTSHSYTVKAYNSAGESAASAEVSGTTGGCTTGGPLPKHFLTGYWHDFANAAAELKLADVPSEYDLVAVAFGEATTTRGQVTFAVDPGLSSSLGGYTDAQFKADVQTLHSRGKKVILSVGGQNGAVQVSDSSSANAFADSVYSLMQSYGFDGVDIDLENGLNATYMGQALHSLRTKAGANLIVTMAPQTIDMQSTGGSYFQLALNIKDILTVVHMQYYNSGSMLGCDQKVYSQGTEDFITALACIQLENGLRADQVSLGLPAGSGAAGGGVVSPSTVNNALDCLAKATNCGSFKPPHTYPDIRGAMTWSVNWDVTNGNGFAKTVRPHLDTLP
ncbi:cellulose binding domain-containing protein [Actinomadura barringtoniae]|uniref:chitinase n=1 Tax=Actinomadura barringtoniae TaxID=1427535 RepID=A0A939PEJ8_9ACTN|nr:glycosyl hydrolase family 18 protein [Actinomadura barringtoniae]MBO2451185.1 cellulose binding domain-containing protein [Actinomadura barringtoniae]